MITEIADRETDSCVADYGILGARQQGAETGSFDRVWPEFAGAQPRDVRKHKESRAVRNIARWVLHFGPILNELIRR
jgi:hypothetical protein